MKSIISILACMAFGSVTNAAQAPQNGLFNNVDYAPIADLINSAQSSISMEIYEMDDPAVVNAIKSALQRGVSVRIVQEPQPVGASCRVFDSGFSSDQEDQDSEQPHHASGAIPCDQLRDLVSQVNNAGGHYVPFNKSTLCPGGGSCFEHGKISVIDSSVALISTGNFNVSNLCDRDASPVTCDRDFSYVTRDSESVTALESVVKADAEGSRYDLQQILSPGAQRKLTVGPLTLDSLVQFIGTARESIEIENQYLKEKTLNDALMEAARRGVKVSVMVASACSFGRPRPSEVSLLTKIFQGFDEAGISTRMFTKNMQVGGFAGYLHAKAIVIDGQHAWMGSANGSTEALSHNREFGAYFDESDDVSKLDGVLKADFADTNGESWQDSLDCAENSSHQSAPSPEQPEAPKPPRPHRHH